MIPTPTSNTAASSKPTKPFDPRKRVAVRKARGANIKVIERNRTDSPLIRLPDEIIERVFTHVIGGQVVHIKCFKSYFGSSFITRKTLRHSLLWLAKLKRWRIVPRNMGMLTALVQREEKEEKQMKTMRTTLVRRTCRLLCCISPGEFRQTTAVVGIASCQPAGLRDGRPYPAGDQHVRILRCLLPGHFHGLRAHQAQSQDQRAPDRSSLRGHLAGLWA